MNFITLKQYLKYVDLYHHGDANERCKVTFKLMSGTKNDKVELKEFTDYLQLILGAIKKVHPAATDNLLTKKDMEILFYKISKNRKSFNYDDFENIYHKKPELISWIDYFKKNDDDILYSMDDNIKKLVHISLKFFENFSLKSNQNLFSMIQNDSYLKDTVYDIDNFCKKLDKEKKKIDDLYGFDLKRILHKQEPRFSMKSFNETNNNNNNNNIPYNIINRKSENLSNQIVNSARQKSDDEKLNPVNTNNILFEYDEKNYNINDNNHNNNFSPNRKSGKLF